MRKADVVAVILVVLTAAVLFVPMLLLWSALVGWIG